MLLQCNFYMENRYFIIITVVSITLQWYFALKTTFNPKHLNILKPKVTKNLTNLHEKFCESPPCFVIWGNKISHIINMISVSDAKVKKCFKHLKLLDITVHQAKTVAIFFSNLIKFQYVTLLWSFKDPLRTIFLIITESK